MKPISECCGREERRSVDVFLKTIPSILFAVLAVASSLAADAPKSPPGLTFANVPYGRHERQVLDFFQAKSATPTPVVFYVHGGSWLNGDKSRVDQVSRYLAAGISVVSINYRYIPQAQADGLVPPVKGPLMDAARALQFVRSKAAEWNLDKERIGGTGVSAGGCSVLWLAFHPDMAEPDSADPIARESTRLWCAAVSLAQTTLDPQQMKEWTPNSRYGGHAFGIGSFAQFVAKRGTILPWIAEYSPYALVSADDPPVYLNYLGYGDATPALGQDAKDPTHTPNFGVKLQEKCRATGIPCELVYRGAPEVKHAQVVDYLLAQLKANAKPAKLSAAVTKPDALELGFAKPPSSAKPGVWWLWMNGNVTREGITRDLEEMARQGIGRALLYDLAGFRNDRSPKGSVDFLGPQWRELFRHAVSEAARVGIELEANQCSGYNSGGPWIPVEHSSQRLIWSEKKVEGPVKFDALLPMPTPVVDKHYRDIAVLAFRTNAPPPEDAKATYATAAQSTTAYRMGAERAIDGNTNGAWGFSSLTFTGGILPGTGARDVRPWWQLDLAEDAVVDEIVLWRRNDAGIRNDELDNAEVSVLDAQKQELWRTKLGRVEQPSVHLKIEARGDGKARHVRIEKPGVLAIAEVQVFSGGRNIALGKPASRKRIQDWEAKAVRIVSGAPVEFRSGPGPAAVGAPDVVPESMLDLSDKLDAQGRLVWDAPPGSWTVLRFGHSSLGMKTHYSADAGSGYEVDPMSREAMDLHFAAHHEKLIADAGAHAGKTLRGFFMDSFEAGAPNWTPQFRAEFQRRRGYDLTPYLPALTGLIVQSGEVTERFLWDYRRTIADLFAEHFYGRATELCRERGLAFQAEAYGGYFDVLQNLGRITTPCGEFWSSPTRVPDALTPFISPMDSSMSAAASAGHIYGRRIIHACGFIGYDKWQTHPFLLKSYADRAFCEGINQLASGVFAHQPQLDARPGLCPPWGCITDRNITWWPQSHAWHAYLARCSFLLQQGLPVTDVCSFRGEGTPYTFSPEPALIPAGHSADECNAEVILTRMSVKDGRLVLPDGMSYRVLTLPDERAMTPRLLRKITALVEAGATVVGPKPTHSPSLQNHPACDDEVRQLADVLWGDCDGKTITEHRHGQGKVIWGRSLREVLADIPTAPDFEYASTQKDASARWSHRRTDDAEIYFIANLRNRAQTLECTFRVHGKAPELWMPDTGAITPIVAYEEVNERTRLTLPFEPLGSAFVLFRRAAETTRIAPLTKANGSAMPAPLTIPGPWKLSFPAASGAPASTTFAKLISWTKHPEPGVKYFSGTATYHKEIAIPASHLRSDATLHLDLGQVREIAEVRLNGIDLGILWKPPFRADITRAAKPGKNQLEVRITNLWPNRLIGDQSLPEAERIAHTPDTSFKKESPLLDSGLLGPVTIKTTPCDDQP